MGTSLEVGEGRLIGGDHSGASTGLDGHIAHGHAAFHRKLTNCLTAILKDVSLSSTGSDLRDHGQDDVFCGRALGQRTVHGNSHGLERSHGKCLGSKDVLDLTGSNSHCQSAKSTVRRGVRVTADDSHAGLSQSKLRANDVDDSLIGVPQGVQTDTKFLRIFAQSIDLRAAGDICDRQINVHCGGVVIFGCDREIGATHLASSHAQTIKCLRAGHFMNQMQVDVEQVRGAIFPMYNYVISPDLLGQRSTHFPLLLRLLSSHD